MASYEPFLAKWRAEVAAGVASSVLSVSATASPAPGDNSGGRIVCSSPNGFTICHTLEDFINGGKTPEGLEVVRHVLANGCTRNGTNISGEEAINSAAVIDGDFADDGPVTCLYVCAYTNQLETINLLLANGADPDAPVTLHSPMSQAALAGNVDVIRRLVDHGCDINARDTFGITPLHVGCEQLASVPLMLELGADPTIAGPMCDQYLEMKATLQDQAFAELFGVDYSAVSSQTQVTAMDTIEIAKSLSSNPDVAACYELIKAAFEATSAVRTSFLL